MSTTEHGGMINPANVSRDFKALLQSAGLRTIRFHDVRSHRLTPAGPRLKPGDDQ
ncbi:hypothetical protein [Streptosporangium sp. NPDC049304]|uniref:hypothetical protein n=1 Tax=Streptosporangium sp. NPDC049304 TaxID=3154830 RepID=UPI00342F2017